MVTCRTCGLKSSDQANFCQFCGKPIQDSDIFSRQKKSSTIPSLESISNNIKIPEKKINNPSLEYTGKIQPSAGERDRETGQILYPYLPSLELIKAVNLAIELERPLLLKGEPGCGKTKLTRALAYEFETRYGNWPYETWHIKSTSQARDGLYTYDAIGRLRDAQLAATGRIIKDEDIARISDPRTYIELGPLGRAFINKKKTIVLIDEIDKADIDFPNDLLLELDERCFFIEETRQKVNAQVAPILIITSNDEKDLPDAFLRRCLFHYVKFPDTERLIAIIRSIFPNSNPRLVDNVVNRFELLRETMQKDKGKSGKKVSTSELLDWFKVLNRRTKQQNEICEKLEQSDCELPYAEVLLKSQEDYDRYVK